jgi:excisionase family DNA binding protein
MTPIQKHYRPVEVAKLLGVSRAAIYLWIAEGRIKAVRYGPRSMGIAETEVRKFMAGTPSEAGGTKE